MYNSDEEDYLYDDMYYDEEYYDPPPLYDDEEDPYDEYSYDDGDSNWD